ncbi:ABC-type phosphate/phosphonate transport system, ATPase component [Gynuella sunshinyii YC6258]|uniref:ABC-type phosphate/phosphonate transport system, ATPase component n=2 Tax=Gynuella sunshinyii TaxID=1445505 RepID=A0A0C5VKK9_9GAMM|nr:ABC-type phosphate/phosphonate transport system, ATPase component [Gynuella sunshinyii YC6258]
MLQNALSTPLFSLNHANLDIGRTRILHDISLEVHAGEKIVLIGPSGAGKSSLLEWLYQQQAGSIALCPQASGLVDVLSSYQNIFMGGLERHGSIYNLWNLIRPHIADRQHITRLAADLGIADQLWKSVDQLSGGQRQRVAIGRALFRQQPVFFGDEPVSALDPAQSEIILKLLIERHQTLLVSLHNRRLALDHFDRVIALKHGRIQYDGPVSGLTSDALDGFYA